MITFDDDFVRLNMSVGSHSIPLVKLGLAWPPPERLYFEAEGIIREVTDGDEAWAVMKQTRRSQITDEMRAEMTHVCRGAEYEYESPLNWDEVLA